MEQTMASDSAGDVDRVWELVKAAM